MYSKKFTYIGEVLRIKNAQDNTEGIKKIKVVSWQIKGFQN